jgi:hypothetical protein
MRSMIVGALLLTASVAQADTVGVIGVGQSSCGEFIAAVGGATPGRQRRMNTASGAFISENVSCQQWLLGFLSGFNSAHASDVEQQVKGIDLAGLDLWMRNWCNKHPTRLVFEGAEAFINEMRSNHRP